MSNAGAKKNKTPQIDIEVKPTVDPMKFKSSDAHNQKAVQKATVRMAAIWATHQESPDPLRLDPDSILWSPHNRKPNMKYIGSELGPNWKTNGYDRKRPRAGFCIQWETKEQIEYMIMKNKEMQDGCDFYPRIIPEIASRDALASSHHNMCQRCFKHSVTSSLTGFHFSVDEDPELQILVSQGHWFYKFRPTISAEECRFVYP